MRIVIVCSRLGYGGAERVAVMWANGFAERGYDVTLVSNLFEDITYELSEKVRLRNLVSTNKNRLMKWGSSFFLVRKVLKEQKPDVVIGVMRTCSFVAKMASMGLGVPVVMTEHNSFERPKDARMSIGEKISKRNVNRLYDAVTVLTEADKALIGKRLKRVYVLPNPLSLKTVEIVPPKEKRVLAAGRIDAWHSKGFDVLIKAFGLLMKNEELRIKSPGWRLQIAGTGSGESLAYLKQLCRENGVEDSVDFLGFRTDIGNLFKQASVFVLSSRYEGFGLVLIEAMSQGCACVACDYKGRQREIIQDDSQGLCCEPDNVGALADALTKMMGDENYRENVRFRAIERSKYYCIENIIDQWEVLLKQVTTKIR